MCQDTVEVEQAEVEEPQDPGTYPTTAELPGGGDLAHQQDGTQLVQPVGEGEGRHDSHTTQLRRTRSVPKYFILKVIQ